MQIGLELWDLVDDIIVVAPNFLSVPAAAYIGRSRMSFLNISAAACRIMSSANVWGFFISRCQLSSSCFESAQLYVFDSNLL